MIIDNITPFSIGCLVTIDSEKRYKSTLFIKAALKLVPDVVVEPFEKQVFPQPDTTLQDFGRKGESLAYPSDFVPWKPRADSLFVGSAYPPENHLRDDFRIGFRVGHISKQLIVNLDERNESSLPISYENAYGGPGFEPNPVGVGYCQNQLPLIRYPNSVRNSAQVPASFAPIPAEWEPRKSKIGEYRGDAEKLWPGMPRDFDWGYFNSAPVDQQLDGYLVGDEDVTLENMIPGYQIFSTQLPGIRVVCVREDYNSRCLLVPLNLDTLWINGDQMIAILIWRGQMPIETPECFEINRIGFIAESLDSSFKEATYYRDQIDAVLKSQVREYDEEQPAIGTEPESPVTEVQEVDNVEEEDLESKTLNAEIAAMKKSLGIKETQVPPNPKPLSLGDMPPLPPELQSKVDDAMAQMEQQDIEFEAQEAELKWTRERVIAAVENHQSFDGIDLSGIDLSKCQFADGDFQGATLVGVDFRGSVLSRARFDRCNLQDTLFHGSKLESSNFELADLTGTQFVNADLSRAILNEAILSDVVIENSDLAGSECKKALFENASLRVVSWQGAELSGASFDNSRIEKSDFRKAMLADASFASATLTQIRLDEADISFADFGKTVFEDAILDGVTAVGTDFTEANLSGASFKAAICKGTWFSSATIDHANFEGASCVEMHLDACSAKQTNFASADISSLRGGEKSDLTGACFENAHGAAPIFESCVLDDADFSTADIEGANFIKASLRKTRMIATEMKFSRFDYANCNQTRFDYANLFESGFADSDLTDANFSGANLYASEFLNAKIKGAILKDANIKMTELNSWLRA